MLPQARFFSQFSAWFLALLHAALLTTKAPAAIWTVPNSEQGIFIIQDALHLATPGDTIRLLVNQEITQTLDITTPTLTIEGVTSGVEIAGLREGATTDTLELWPNPYLRAVGVDLTLRNLVVSADSTRLCPAPCPAIAIEATSATLLIDNCTLAGNLALASSTSTVTLQGCFLRGTPTFDGISTTRGRTALLASGGTLAAFGSIFEGADSLAPPIADGVPGAPAISLVGTTATFLDCIARGGNGSDAGDGYAGGWGGNGLLLEQGATAIVEGGEFHGGDGGFSGSFEAPCFGGCAIRVGHGCFASARGTKLVNAILPNEPTDCVHEEGVLDLLQQRPVGWIAR